MKLLLLLGLFAVFVSVYAPITKPKPAAAAPALTEIEKRELGFLKSANDKYAAAEKANKKKKAGEDLVVPNLSTEELDALRKNKTLAVLIENELNVLKVPENKRKVGFWRGVLEKLHVKKACTALGYRQDKRTIKVKLAELIERAAEREEERLADQAMIKSLKETVENLEEQRRRDIETRDEKILDLTCENWELSWLVYDRNISLIGAKAENEALQGKNAQLESDLRVARMKIGHLETKVRKLEEEKKTLESKIRELTAANDVLERWVKNLIKDNKNLSRQNERKARLIHRLDQRVASLQAKLVARNIKIRTLTRQVELQNVLLASYVSQINSLTADKTKLQKTVEQLTKEKDTITREVGVLSGKLEKLEEWKAETLKQVAKLEADKKALENEKTNLEKDHKAEVDRINAANKEEVLRLSNTIELKNLRIQTLEGDYERFRTLHETSVEELGNTRREHDFAKTTITELRTQVNNLDKERQAEKTAAQTANNEKANLDKAVGILETNLAHAQQAEKDLNRIKGELEGKIKELEGAVKLQQDKKRGYKEGVKMTEAQLREERQNSLNVQHALDAARTKQSELEAQISEYKANVGSLTGRILEIETSAAGERKDLNKTITELRAENLKNAEEIGSLKQSAANLEQILTGLRETEKILNNSIATKQGENKAIKEAREEDNKKAQATIEEMIKQASGHQKTIEELQAKIKKTEEELKTAGTEKSGALADLQALKEQYRETERRVAAEHTELQKRASALESDLMAANRELGGLKALVEDLKLQREDFKKSQDKMEEKEQRYANEASIVAAELLEKKVEVELYKLKMEKAQEETAAAKKGAKQEAKAAADHAAKREKEIEKLEELLEEIQDESEELGSSISLLEYRIEEMKEGHAQKMAALVAEFEKEKIALAAELKKILTDAQFDCQCPTASAWTKILHWVIGHDAVSKEEAMASVQNSINTILYKKKIDAEDSNKVQVKITQDGPAGKAKVEIKLDEEQWNLFNGLGPAARVVFKHGFSATSQ